MEKLNICGKRSSSEILMLTLTWDMQTLVGDYSTPLASQMVGEPSRVPDLLKVNVHLRNQTWRVIQELGGALPGASTGGYHLRSFNIAMEKHNCK